MIRIGISSCLLGERVRYNGGHKRAAFLEALGDRVEWVPVCPEVEVGMGVPREPVRLERTAGGVRMAGVESRVDHTEAMKAWAERRIDALVEQRICGYVLKKDSPSCGLRGVDVHDAAGATPEGRGLFAQALLARLPRLPMEEEDRLADASAREEFLRRCREYDPTQHASGARAVKRSEAGTHDPYRRVRVVRYGRDAAGGEDLAATEEPLEVRLHGRPFSVIMRTPGADRALAAGFLLAEGVITSAADVGAIEQCRHPDHPQVHNVVDVFLVGPAATSLDARLAQRRSVTTTSSCGLCGRTTIDSLGTRADTLPIDWKMHAATIAQCPERLRERQAIFGATGGLHAAGLFTTDGLCIESAEDVGRHNAVDKVIGAMLLSERLPLQTHALAVSGRSSFEIVQKAWLAGIRLVCAVSAPSSLAVELAEQAGITLIGFARNGGFNIYSHEARIRQV